MAPLIPWMTRTDRYVLDLLDRAGIVATPKTVWLELCREHGEDAPSKRQVSRRLKDELSEYELVRQPFADEARGYYELTELGERFLHDPDAEPTEFVADIGDDSSPDTTE